MNYLAEGTRWCVSSEAAIRVQLSTINRFSTYSIANLVDPKVWWQGRHVGARSLCMQTTRPGLKKEIKLTLGIGMVLASSGVAAAAPFGRARRLRLPPFALLLSILQRVRSRRRRARRPGFRSRLHEISLSKITECCSYTRCGAIVICVAERSRPHVRFPVGAIWAPVCKCQKYAAVVYLTLPREQRSAIKRVIAIAQSNFGGARLFVYCSGLVTARRRNHK